MNSQTEQIISIINSIPIGKVISYGGVAALSGNPKAARQVSWILKLYSKKLNLPWFRIINSKGYISIKDEENYILQKKLLKNEGITFDKNDKIDLRKFMWNGISIDKN